MKNRIILVFVFLTFSYLLPAQDFLNQYLRTAAENNPGLKAKFNEYNASLEKIPQVGALPDPTLTFGYFIMPVETKNGPQQAKISLTQMFPWFGTLNSKEDIYISIAKARYEEFEEAKSRLFFDVKATYFDLYYIRKSMSITLENIDILETVKRMALIKIESGTASGIDEIRVEMELNDLKNTMDLLNDKWFVFTVKFNKLLNTDYNTEIQIPDTLWTYDLPYSERAIFDSLKQNNHQLRAFDFIKESFLHKEESGRKEGNPNIVLGMDYTSIGNNGISVDAGRDAFLIKVGITLPLYRKKYTALVNEAIIQQQIADDKKHEKTNALEVLFEKVYSEYTDANRRIILYEKQRNLAKRAISLLENEYASNGKNFEEILRMNNSLLKYSLELEKARADKQAAIAFINYLTGY